VSNGGVYIASRHADWIGQKAAEKGLDQAIVDAAAAGKEALFPSLKDSTGAAVVRATAPITLNGMATPWSVVVTVPEATLFAATSKLTMTGLLIGLLTLLAASAIAYFVGNAVAKPVRRM